MNRQRRFFLRTFVSGFIFAGASAAEVFSASGLQQQGNPPSRIPPTNPTGNGPTLPPPFRKPTHAELRKNQQEITKDVDQLFTLAQQLKREADKTDASEELSVALLDKTEQIEKLAKKIRELARS